jgi:alpha-L-fucosidase 2
MLFGHPDEEVVQLNENSLWGGVNDYDNALAGEPDDAFDTSMSGFGSYRDFGRLRVAFAGRARVTTPGGPYQDSADGETVRQTYDGEPGTKWCVVAPPEHVLWQVELPAPAVVGSYSLTSANDVPERDPQRWSVLGSHDGRDWTTLDTRERPPFEERHQRKTFEIAGPTAYRFYRVDFEPVAGVSHFQVAEVELDGVDLAVGDAVHAVGRRRLAAMTPIAEKRGIRAAAIRAGFAIAPALRRLGPPALDRLTKPLFGLDFQGFSNPKQGKVRRSKLSSA